MSSLEKLLSNDADLSTGLKVSVGLHIALVAVFSIRAAFFAPEQIDYTAAVRVDIVGLPDKIQEQTLPPKQEALIKPEAKPEPKPAPAEAPKVPPKEVKDDKVAKAPKKDADAIDLNKEKKKQKEALEKLKAMSAIDELKKEIEKESDRERAKRMAGAGDSKSQPNKIKGNVLSPGTALTGLSRLQHDSYLSSLDQKIKQNWFLPEWLAKKPLRTQVRLKIDENGQILSREITLSSGNSSYDELALETIDKSAPFAPPPEKFVSIVAVNGLLIGFPE